MWIVRDLFIWLIFTVMVAGGLYFIFAINKRTDWDDDPDWPPSRELDHEKDCKRRVDC